MPLRPGRVKSSSTRSKGCSPMRCKPSSPSTALSTENPSISSRVCSDSRISDSSSMMSTEPDGPGLPCAAPRVMTAASDMNRLPAQGKIQGKRGSGARVTFDANFSRVLLDDAVGNRKAQPGAAALAFLRRSLGSKEWIVDSVDVLRRNARPTVGHLHAHRTAVGGGDTQRSAARHGIFGIEKQIQKHLLQAPGIALNRRNVVREFRLNFNLRNLELMLQQRQRVSNDLIDVEVGKLAAAGARKIQQIVDDLRRAERLPRDLFQQPGFLRIGLQLLGEALLFRRTQ